MFFIFFGEVGETFEWLVTVTQRIWVNCMVLRNKSFAWLESQVVEEVIFDSVDHDQGPCFPIFCLIPLVLVCLIEIWILLPIVVDELIYLQEFKFIEVSSSNHLLNYLVLSLDADQCFVESSQAMHFHLDISFDVWPYKVGVHFTGAQKDAIK